MQSPTGSGKTRTFSEIIKNYVKREQKIAVLAHRDHIIRAVDESLSSLRVSRGIIHRCNSTNPRGYVQIVSVGSLRSRELPCTPALIVVDEAHRAKANTYMEFFNNFSDAKRLLVTATPCRLSGEGFADVADDIILGPKISELIEHPEGPYLVPMTAYTGEFLAELGRIPEQYNDYDQKQLESYMLNRNRIQKMLTSYKTLAAGRRGLIYACSVDHSKAIYNEFTRGGVRISHCDSKTPTKERDDMKRAIKEGHLDLITSVNVFTEGLDIPEADVVMMARPTMSVTVFMQQAGRGMRISPGKKDCLLIDHANNIRMHGHPEQERRWSLSGKVTRLGNNWKECPHCKAWNHPSYFACYKCGYGFESLIQVVDNSIDLLIQSNKMVETCYNYLTVAIKKKMNPGQVFRFVQAKHGTDVFTKTITPQVAQRLLKKAESAVSQGRI
jgi:superfamily II DNA or RNA helicase